MDAPRPITVVLALLILTAWWYLPVREASLMYEDAHWHRALYADHVRIHLGVSGRPVGYHSLRWPRDPGGAHAVNVGLHLVTAGLVYATAAALTTPLVAG